MSLTRYAILTHFDRQPRMTPSDFPNYRNVQLGRPGGPRYAAAERIAAVSRFDEGADDAWVGQLGALLPSGAVLLLDNLEHLQGVADAVGAIMASRPDVTVLATSRSISGLDAAAEYAVGPLPVPAACQVFEEVARRSGRPLPAKVPGDLIEQVCVRLDLLPLTVILAATWSRLMTPQEILARLDRATELLRVPEAPGRELGGPAGSRHSAVVSTVGWSRALESAGLGLDQSQQADEAAVVSLAPLVAAVHLDATSPARIGDDVLTLERMVRKWASVPGGVPYPIAVRSARRRGLRLPQPVPEKDLPSIKEVRQLALALCDLGADPGGTEISGDRSKSPPVPPERPWSRAALARILPLKTRRRRVVRRCKKGWGGRWKVTVSRTGDAEPSASRFALDNEVGAAGRTLTNAFALVGRSGGSP
jgi:hypothetical protein